MITRKLLTCLALLLVFTSPVRADSLLGGRVGAENPEILAAFYKTVFGVYEVDRFTFQDGSVEVMLNFGDNQEDAKNNDDAEIVLMPRVSNDIDDEIPHLIFNVDDIHATMADVQASGGSLQSEEPTSIPAGQDTIMIAIVRDPANNLIELIQQP